MLDFLSKLFKARDTAVSPRAEPKIHPDQNSDASAQAVQEPEVVQKWNIKLGVYDTPLAGCEQVVFHGAGMEHHMDALLELAIEDLDYTCTKSEMKKFLLINRRVYQYKFNPTSIDLIPEPENQYDKNAVKIILNDRHVGYIRASEAVGSVDLFNSDRVKRVQVAIQGGKYKILLGDGSYFDGSEPLSEFTLKKDEAPFSIRIHIDVAKN